MHAAFHLLSMVQVKALCSVCAHTQLPGGTHHKTGTRQHGPPLPYTQPQNCLSQAVPLVEFAAGATCCQAAFLPAGLGAPVPGTSTTSSSSSSKIVAGYADGCLRCYDVGACCVTWSSVRHPASIVALLAHPTQPLVMAASRWVGGRGAWKGEQPPHTQRL
jgi:hypothetical protein